MIVALSAGRDTSPELRARLSLTEDACRALLEGPHPGLAELAVLSTCHRTELYATGDGSDAELVHALVALMPGLQPTDQQELRFMQGAEAMEHLFRVTAGLDSLVIGETQVLGQVRRAMLIAEEAGSLGPVLSHIFQRAIRIGKDVRNSTALGSLGRSIGSIATRFLSDHLGDLSQAHALVIGAGEAARDVAGALKRGGANLSIISRTQTSADILAAELGGTAFPMSSLSELLAESDFAVAAVSGGTLIKGADFPPRPARPYLILDLSVPPAVETSGRTDVDIRSLEDIPGPRGPEVTAAVIDAEAIVQKEIAELLSWADSRASGPIILELQKMAERLTGEEIARVTASMKLTADQEDKVRQMAARITGKLLHGPTAELRRADEQTRNLIRRIFRLDG